MKKFLFLVVSNFFVVSNITIAQPTDVLISEYIEGTSNNKALEFYNGTGSSIDLLAGGYAIEMYFNGNTTAGLTIYLTGTVANDDVYVLAHSSASATILAVSDQTNGSGWFNGDDCIVLKKGTTILDVIGQVGFDPGTEWGSGLTSTADNTLRRKAGTTVGDTNPADAFDPSVEWDGFATDTFDGLGSPVPLPVELSSFSASIINDGVKLNWRTETEVNNYGFEIEKSQMSNVKSQTEWTKIGFVEGHGNSNSPKEYSFLDDNVSSGKYAYKLKQIDNDGTFEYSKVIEVDVNVPLEFELSQNYPNPFNPTTTIKYSLPVTSFVKLSVFNLLGEEVQILMNEIKEAGIYTINFNALQLKSGMYFYKLETENSLKVKKMTFLK